MENKTGDNHTVRLVDQNSVKIQRLERLTDEKVEQNERLVSSINKSRGPKGWATKTARPGNAAFLVSSVTYKGQKWQLYF